MATIKRPLTAKLRTNKDSLIESVDFAAGDAVTIAKSWDRFYLVKDAQGHFYTLRHEDVEP
jgi:hypothetical protein